MKQFAASTSVLPAPPRPASLPAEAQWLSGEGAGSWFHIARVDTDFYVSRFGPDGKPECAGIFRQVSGPEIVFSSNYQFTYLSHCAEVNILQDGTVLKFMLLRKA